MLTRTCVSERPNLAGCATRQPRAAIGATVNENPADQLTATTGETVDFMEKIVEQAIVHATKVTGPLYVRTMICIAALPAQAEADH